MKNEHQPAFPYVDNTGHYEDRENHYGINKREYFAAMAMQGILANSPDWDNQEKHHEMVAKMSTGYADELLKQLSQ